MGATYREHESENALKRIIQWVKNFLRHRDLLNQLVKRDIKLKYRRSFLGYLWSVLNPLFTMLVMWVVFSNLFRFEIENFPVYLLTGQVLFGFMNEATNMSMLSIVSNASLMKKTYIPKYIFTLSRVTSALVNLLFSMVALLLVTLITGVPLTWRALLFMFPVIQLYFFCLGLGLFLAQAAVFFRDLQYIWGVILTAWIYLTPIFYPISIMPEQLQNIIKVFNPMYAYIAQFRDCILLGVPSGPKIIYAGIGWAIIMMALGIWRFVKNQDRFILYI